MLHSVVAPPHPLEQEKEAQDGRANAPDAGKTPSERFVQAVRPWLAELVGTFALTLVAAGGEVINAVSGGQVGAAARAVAPGLMVMALIYALGDASGAHLNPAVSLAFALRRCFPWRHVPGYWAMQIVGAVSAAYLLHSLFGDAGHLGAPRPHYSLHAALVMETLLTFLLVTVILGTATRYSLVGPNAALAVGATISLCGLFAAPISGASMNPARSLGPMLVGGETQHAWLYVLGPVLGSVLATGLMAILHDQRDPKEDEAAEGGKNTGEAEGKNTP